MCLVVQVDVIRGKLSLEDYLHSVFDRSFGTTGGWLAQGSLREHTDMWENADVSLQTFTWKTDQADLPIHGIQANGANGAGCQPLPRRLSRRWCRRRSPPRLWCQSLPNLRRRPGLRCYPRLARHRPLRTQDCPLLPGTVVAGGRFDGYGGRDLLSSGACLPAHLR